MEEEYPISFRYIGTVDGLEYILNSHAQHDVKLLGLVKIMSGQCHSNMVRMSVARFLSFPSLSALDVTNLFLDPQCHML